MMYAKQSWAAWDERKTNAQNEAAGALLTAERMNHMEEGIEDAVNTGDFRAQLTDTKLQISVNGGTSWIDVCEKADITGPQGAAGQKGVKGDKGEPGEGITGTATAIPSLAADADVAAVAATVNNIITALQARGVLAAN